MMKFYQIMYISTIKIEHKFSRCVPERNLKKNLELDLEPAVDVQEEKNTLQSELPEQSHEPMKHSGRIH